MQIYLNFFLQTNLSAIKSTSVRSFFDDNNKNEIYKLFSS